MIIARHQLLIFDNSIFKMPKRLRYCKTHKLNCYFEQSIEGVFFIITCGIQLGTLFAIFSIYSDRKMQNEVLDEVSGILLELSDDVRTFQNIQIKWRERGLNWFLFYGPGLPALMYVSKYAGIVQVSVFIVLVLAPFAHMLYIVQR